MNPEEITNQRNCWQHAKQFVIYSSAVGESRVKCQDIIYRHRQRTLLRNIRKDCDAAATDGI